MTPKAFNKAMGAVLDKERKARGMTLKEIGDALGVTYQQVQKLTTGHDACSAFRLAQLAQLFEMEPGTLYAAVMKFPKSVSVQSNDAFMAARYVSKIANPTTRAILVDQARQFAYRGGPV